MKVGKGAGMKLSLDTKTAWRQLPGTAAHPQTIKFEGRCEDLKGFIFDGSEVSNTDKYSTSMKEVSEYILCKFRYKSDIQRYLSNEIKIGVPYPMNHQRGGTTKVYLVIRNVFG